MLGKEIIIINHLYYLTCDCNFNKQRPRIVRYCIKMRKGVQDNDLNRKKKKLNSKFVPYMCQVYHKLHDDTDDTDHCSFKAFIGVAVVATLVFCTIVSNCFLTQDFFEETLKFQSL